MLADEKFRTRLNATIMTLRAFAEGLSDVARFELTESVVAWRLSMAPNAPSACPFELVLRSDQQYDIAIATEVFEDRRIEDVEIFPRLAEAIADGRVMIRRFASAATGIDHSREVVVTLADGRQWSATNYNSGLLGRDDFDLVEAVRHFVPYRRAAPIR